MQLKLKIMLKGMLHLHITSVVIFMVIYLIKTILLVVNANEKLEVFKKKTKVLEMIVSTAFLATGAYMLFNIPEIKPILVVKIALVFAAIPIAIIGYKKGNKGMAILSLLFIIGAYGLAEMSKKQTKTAALPGDAANNMNDEDFAQKFGKDLYTIECARCHGVDGKLGMNGAFDLSVSSLTVDEAIQIITAGKASMPAFKDALSEKQIIAVAQYSQSLKK